MEQHPSRCSCLIDSTMSSCPNSSSGITGGLKIAGGGVLIVIVVTFVKVASYIMQEVIALVNTDLEKTPKAST